MSTDWASLETHVVNGAFPLERCLGSSDHSGVFLTHATRHAPSAVALKLVPFDEATGPSQLARWRAAVELSHPHLVRLFEVGECLLDGRRHLFARMELADKTLGDVLEERPITEDEAHEVLAPTLAALDHLHRNGKVQGALKPSNILIVGNRLKLASDTVRAIGETGPGDSTAEDVRALGAVLNAAVKPMPDALRALVDRCLSPEARARPTVAELQAWLNGEPLAEASPEPPAESTRLVIRVELPSDEPPAELAPPRAQWRVVPIVIVAAVLLALVAWGVHALRSRSPSAPPRFEALTPAPAPPVVEAPAAPPPTPPAPVPAPSPAPVPVTPPADTSAPVNEVLPTVSRSALDTIRGTVRVAVRVVVDGQGRVISATADDPGPSRYFAQRSLDAAKQWTFAPSDASGRRTFRVRFEFRRSGASASATPVP